MVDGPILSSRFAESEDELWIIANKDGCFFKDYPFWDAATKASATLLRKHFSLIPFLAKKNIKDFNLQKKSIIFEKNAYDLNKVNLGNKKFDLIFLDPPFKDKNIYQLVEVIKKSKIINNNTLLIIHRNKKFKENISEYLKILREKNYGLSKIFFCKIN